LKTRIRNEIRHLRRSLDRVRRRSADAMINQNLVDLAEKSGCNSLSAFFCFDGEPDLRPAMEILTRRGVRIALPVIVNAAEAPEMAFRRWNPATPLEKNVFGIDEPVSGETVHPRDLDLVVMPLVAWDENGQRLGMGAGYYDRALAAVAGCERPLRVGVAYEVQKVAQLPADPWDVRLHRVITENGIFTCANIAPVGADP
jgi:5-formyltetrahydrofolate cyclo-ligase